MPPPWGKHLVVLGVDLLGLTGVNFNTVSHPTGENLVYPLGTLECLYLFADFNLTCGLVSPVSHENPRLGPDAKNPDLSALVFGHILLVLAMAEPDA